MWCFNGLIVFEVVIFGVYIGCLVEVFFKSDDVFVVCYIFLDDNVICVFGYRCVGKDLNGLVGFNFVFKIMVCCRFFDYLEFCVFCDFGVFYCIVIYG